MKILWLCNACPSFVGTLLGERTFNNMGWLDSIGSNLIKTENVCIIYPSSEETIQSLEHLSIYTFPYKHDRKYDVKSMVSYSVDDGFPRITDRVIPYPEIVGVNYKISIAAINRFAEN